MDMPKLNKTILRDIDDAVEYYERNKNEFVWLAKTMRSDLTENVSLQPFTHSIKYREKDPEHLWNKLVRIALYCKKRKLKYDITKNNLYTKINDLAGVRLLHLYTKQMDEIHPIILDLLNEMKYHLIGKPKAFTWDIEYGRYFSSLGIKTIEGETESMYTSVHYVIEHSRKTKMRCEIQVRTLMEEVWGEVSHTINYPEETDIICCREQLKVLARTASGCTRLVDSIFASHINHKE